MCMANTCIPIDNRLTPASLKCLGKCHGTYIYLSQNTQYHDTDLSLCSCPEVGLTSRDTSMLGDVGTSSLTLANTASMANGSAKLGVPTANLKHNLFSHAKHLCTNH